MPRKQPDLPGDYVALLAELKGRITAARLKAALAVNSELILLYWQIGHDILRRQRNEGWGAKVVDRLAADLRLAFPEMTGLSPATSNTCGLSRMPIRAMNLCSRSLHKCRGATRWCFSTQSRSRTNANGTCGKPL